MNEGRSQLRTVKLRVEDPGDLNSIVWVPGDPKNNPEPNSSPFKLMLDPLLSLHSLAHPTSISPAGQSCQLQPCLSPTHQQREKSH